MADALTNLGMTVEEYEVANGSLFLSDVVATLVEKQRSFKKAQCALHSVSVDGGVAFFEGFGKSSLDEQAYGVFSKLFDIPMPYLMRLGVGMRDANVQYWLDALSDKEVTFLFSDDMQLVDAYDGMRIEVVDVLEILDRNLPGGKVLRSRQQPNATVLDIYLPDDKREFSGREFYGGVRAVIKRGLKAPEISPLFVDVDSCGMFECDGHIERVSIKNLGYNDILRVVEEQAANARDSLPSLFRAYCSIADSRVANPRRRIALYCREHGLPDRICAYALKAFDDSGVEDAFYGDIIALFGILGYVDEVKQQSERRLQRLAGHIVVKARGENRCGKCDSIVLEM